MMNIIIHKMMTFISKGANMRVAKEMVQRHREDLVRVAAQMLRERGVEGTGVAEVCRAAGLTHGAFYRHFESKEALIAEACGVALQWTIADIAGGAELKAGTRQRIARYLSTAHRDAPANGCPVAALAVDAGRLGQPLSGVLTQGIRRYFEQFAQTLPPGPSGQRAYQSRQQQAMMTLATMIGGLVLARATASADGELSDQILRTVREGLERHFET